MASPEFGGIYWANLRKEGNVQGGKRPVIVAQNNIGNSHSPLISVIPLTTKNKCMPTHVKISRNPQNSGLAYDSYALVEQLQQIPRESIGGYITKASIESLREIGEAMRLQYPFPAWNMRYYNKDLSLFFEQAKEGLTSIRQSILSSALSDINEFENYYGKDIVDMNYETFIHIREGWFSADYRKNETRKLTYAYEFLMWYNTNIRNVVDFDKKIELINNLDDYYKYRRSHYLGIFVKDFNRIFSISNEKYITSTTGEMTADTMVAAMVICYSSGIFQKAVNIKTADFSSDFTEFKYDGVKYPIYEGSEYLKLYSEQEKITTIQNRTLYKTQSQYFLKYHVVKSQIGSKDNIVFNYNTLNAKLRMLNIEYHERFKHIPPTVKFSDQSIALSGYYSNAFKELSVESSDSKWREYIFNHPFKDIDTPHIIIYKDTYLNQNY